MIVTKEGLSQITDKELFSLAQEYSKNIETQRLLILRELNKFDDLCKSLLACKEELKKRNLTDDTQ